MAKTITDVNQLLLKTALLAAHPVGSFYWSEKNTDPGTLFGGTWKQIKGHLRSGGRRHVSGRGDWRTGGGDTRG